MIVNILFHWLITPTAFWTVVDYATMLVEITLLVPVLIVLYCISLSICESITEHLYRNRD